MQAGAKLRTNSGGPPHCDAWLSEAQMPSAQMRQGSILCSIQITLFVDLQVHVFLCGTATSGSGFTAL